MRDAVIMTVYERPSQVLTNVLDGLKKNDLSSTKVIIVDDGCKQSTLDGYPALSEGFEWVHINSVEALPETYSIDDGYNNPAYAFNCGFARAKELGAERVFVLSSDVIVPPHGMEAGRKFVDEVGMFCASVIDMSSATPYCSAGRCWPLPWFIGAKTEDIEAAGAWDEEYMKGIAFEDNDFSARLFMQTQKMLICDAVTCWHQSHEQTAYSDNLKGWEINKRYTLSKWGCVPFEHPHQNFTYQIRSVQPGVTFLLSPDLKSSRKEIAS